jgi:hypothetical protein
MSKQDVRKILSRRPDEDTPDDEGKVTGRKGLPPGSPLAPCGCWGPVDPRMRQPAPQCASGYAQPQMCNVMCQMGGFAWQGVCS